MTRLKGRVALVTGAASGIGAAIVDRFLAEGARVLATDIAALPQQEGDRLKHLRLDAAAEEDWIAAIRAAREELGPLDILVNNAGISSARSAPVQDFDLAEWRRVMAVNLDGVFLGMTHAMRAMQGRGGSIVNIASMLSFAAIPDSPAYCASKGGVLQLTRAGALDGAALVPPVRVNSVHPGYVDTPLARFRFDQISGARERIEGQTPLGRLAAPAEIAAAVAFLASDDASYVTGSALIVDGGYTVR